MLTTTKIGQTVVITVRVEKINGIPNMLHITFERARRQLSAAFQCRDLKLSNSTCSTKLLQCFLCNFDMKTMTDSKKNNRKAWRELLTTITQFFQCAFFSPSCLYLSTLLWTLHPLDSGSAGYMVTAGGNSLCFILLAVNGSWDDNGSMNALIIFLCLRERYCFSSSFIVWAWEGCVCVYVRDGLKRQERRAG